MISENPEVYSLWTLIEDVKLKDTNGLAIANASYTLLMNILRDDFSIAVSAEHQLFAVQLKSPPPVQIT